MLRIIVRNIVSNWCGFIVQAAVVFFLTPFVLRSLGDTRYGIWALVTGLTGYYGLLDLGFRSGITQYLTRHLATRDFIQLNCVAGTAVAALSVCGVLIMFIAGVLSWLAPILFIIPPDSLAEARWCIVIIGASSAISFAFFTYSAVFAATQRYDAANAIGIGVRLISAAATVGSLRAGYGLVGLCALNAGCEILGYVLRSFAACRILPELKISLRAASMQYLWTIAGFGLWTAVVAGAIQFKSYASSLIIGLFLPIAALAPFSLVGGILGYLDLALGQMATVFFPAATHLDALGQREGLRTMYLKGSKMLFFFAVSAGVIGAIWAADFFRLWVGPRLVEGGEYPSVAVLFWLLIGASCITTGQRIGYQILLATRSIRVFSLLVSLEATATVALCLCLIRPYGLVGVCIAALVPAIVFQGIAHPWVLCRLLGIPSSSYFREVLLRPSVVGVLQAGIFAAIHDAAPMASNWISLVGYGLLAGTISLLLIIFIGLHGDERRRLIYAPLTRAARQPGIAKTPRSSEAACAPENGAVLGCGNAYPPKSIPSGRCENAPDGSI